MSVHYLHAYIIDFLLTILYHIIILELSDFVLSVFDGVRVHQRRPLENLRSCEYHIYSVNAASLLQLMCALNYSL